MIPHSLDRPYGSSGSVGWSSSIGKYLNFGWTLKTIVMTLTEDAWATLLIPS